MTYACRTVIASVLLVAGILWLARTTSISELMLNAVALNAILDVDEFLFVGHDAYQNSARHPEPGAYSSENTAGGGVSANPWFISWVW